MILIITKIIIILLFISITTQKYLQLQQHIKLKS